YLISGLGIVTFLSLSLNLLFIPLVFKKMFNTEKWNIKKEIFWNLWILFTIAGGYFIYFQMIGMFEVSFILIVKILAVSIIPITALITIKRNHILRFYLKAANEINKKFDQRTITEEKKVHFISNYIKDNLTININSLLFIRSANNYVEVFWKENDIVKKKLIRSTLKRVEETLKEYSYIIKCHRTNIVNVENIKKIIKSADGDKLFFEKIDFPIIVSRKYINQFRDLIQKYSLILV
ncbi:MAG: LytTR family transcriptional regulator DNA-binding domain-containing protein, partial [Bacteroidales bacterium]|nr:LytTR family transcriptional regulator DNA-binding domain-containing protein [Bacteroidales bacterium]